MRRALRNLTLLVVPAAILACAGSSSKEGAGAGAVSRSQAEGVAAFDVVARVLHHPRCQNCHIPGDAPLQFDEGRVHGQNVLRGPTGGGPFGLGCVTCHAATNPPASYGPHMPPGAPEWRLPSPLNKMVFIGLSARELADQLKTPAKTGGRDLKTLLRHVSEDPLVLWGWNPGVGRAPVDVPHDQFVAAFKTWMDAGAPTPAK